MIIEAKSPVEAMINHSTGVWSSLLSPSVIKQASQRRELRHLLNQTSLNPQDNLDLYNALSNFLINGKNDRFILYCPFNIIPHKELYCRVDPAIDQFIETFSNSLTRMLSVYDIKADFIDGDIPELELNIYPETEIQAKYLAYDLHKKGYLNFKSPEIVRYFEDIPLPWNLNVIDFESPDAINRLVESCIKCCAPSFDNISQKREKWLRWDHKRRSINRFARHAAFKFKSISSNLYDGLTDDALGAVVAAIGRSIENGACYEPFLPFFRYANDRIDLTGVLCRLYHSDVEGIDEEFVNGFGVQIPNITENLTHNLRSVDNEMSRLKQIIESKIVDDLIYPVFIVFGSRLKGYCERSSDVDVAVLVRPGVVDRGAVSRRLFESFGIDVMQYWLDKNAGDLEIRDFKRFDACIGESLDSHVLLNGAWYGDDCVISELSRSLILPYISQAHLAEFRIKQMERDILQYRLLHRGYTKLYPTTTSHTYFDDGYRLAASKLYTTHVFIPK